MTVTDEWADAAPGSAVTGLAGKDHPLRGGGTRFSPARIRVRLSATKPDASDEGDVFEIVSRTPRPIHVPEGQRCWVKAHEHGQRDILVETV